MNEIEDVLGSMMKGRSRGYDTHGFQPLTSRPFKVNKVVWTILQEDKFLGDGTQDSLEHLSKLYKKCRFCCLKGVSESETKLGLFSLTLEGAAKRWLTIIRNKSIHTWEELKEQFTDKYSGINELISKQRWVMNFTQARGETIQHAQVRYKLLLQRCPRHGLNGATQLQFFTQGLKETSKVFMDILKVRKTQEGGVELCWKILL